MQDLPCRPSISPCAEGLRLRILQQSCYPAISAGLQKIYSLAVWSLLTLDTLLSFLTVTIRIYVGFSTGVHANTFENDRLHPEPHGAKN